MTLGDFEQIVLLGVLRLYYRAYGAAIRQEIHARSGRDVPISAVYTTLDRLESKGLLRSWVEPRRSEAVAAASSMRCGPRDPGPETRLPRVHLDGHGLERRLDTK